ncbi:MAG: ABC transporter permease [Defluviitaleaceae bacterium]|nr:ABC transporter permease [Defluviitaleaceae bacterium]
MVIGVFLTFRILQTPDLTVEGTLILGAGLGARLVADGVDPFLATFLAMLIGSTAGLVTGLLHTKLQIPSILAGILTMIGSYSVVIRIMGTSNVSLLRMTTVFTFLTEMGLSGRNSVIVLGLVTVTAVGTLTYCYLGTEIGAAMRATGNNKEMVKALGINIDTMIITCLMVSNGLVGLAGALIAQNQGFASVDMGAGTIVIGLASLIIAEVLFRVRNVWSRLITLVVGAIVYRLIIALVLEMGMAPTDLRLFTAITVAIALSLPMLRDKLAKITSNFGGSKHA